MTTQNVVNTTLSGQTGTGSFVGSASPTLTGTPAAPTASPGTNTTQLATTAFVQAAASGSVTVNVQTFTSGGTYTPTSGMRYCVVQALGGGGAGGGTNGTASATQGSGGGGGSGSYGVGIYSAATIGASQTVTIGAGGAGNSVTPFLGGTGGATSLGSLLVTVGGTGGNGQASPVGSNGTTPGGGGGAAGTGGYINFPGSVGAPGLQPITSFCIGGAGGNSALSGGPVYVAVTGSGVAGNSATANSGAGGGGAAISLASTSNLAGGNGGSGIVIITEYI